MAESRLRTFLISAAVMLALPAGGAKLPAAEIPEQVHTETAAAPQTSAAVYRVLRTETGEIEDIPVREYLIGAVGAEMPASYEPEALKAQAVAVHTYAERIRMQNADGADPSLNGADFSDDSRSYQAFFTEEQLRLFYGDAFDESYAKIAAAVDAVADELLYYEDEPIVAAFHAISAGQTEAAGNIWSTDLPYLVSVSSEGDVGAPQYETVQSIPPETVRKALTALKPDVTFPDDPAQWFGQPEISDAGTVLRIQGGSAVWSGQTLRDALALRSACFTVGYADGQLVFTTKGFGHAVGMSQYGANVMAQNGSSYDEILLHYYQGAVLVRATSGE